MKIAHLVFNIQKGGRSLMVVNLINEQVKTEDVRLFVLDNYNDESVAAMISSRCHIVYMNRNVESKNPLKLIPVIYRLNLQMWKYSPDIIHIHANRIIRPLLWFGPIVRTKHENNKPLTDYWRLKALFAVSYSVKDECAQKRFKSTVVLNGIRTRDIKTKEILPQTVNNSSTSNLFHFVQVGRFYISEKGQDIVLEAIHILRRRGKANFVMHFIGYGTSEALLKEKVLEYGLNDSVIFEGAKSQDYIFQHLCTYDLLIQPSRTEAFGLTVAEAMAAKIPVLVSNIPALMEVIGYGNYGMSFQTENAEDLADKLLSFMQGRYDPAKVEKAYTYACQEYDINKTAEKYIQEYKKLI